MENDSARLARLDREVTQLRVDTNTHVALCDARWRVAWKLAAAVGGLIALVVSVGVAVLVR